MISDRADLLNAFAEGLLKALDCGPNADRAFMELALVQARLQAERLPQVDGERPNPFVGCVVVTNSGRIVRTYRGDDERGKNDHAEFLALTKRGLTDEELKGANVFTTLEPCGERGVGKTSCADWLIEKQVGRVVVGLWDDDPRGQGLRKLTAAGIKVDYFDPHLSKEVRDLNRRFLDSRQHEEALKKLYSAERQLHEARGNLQNWIRPFFEGINHRKGFPLITEPNYLLEVPRLLDPADRSAFLKPLSADAHPNTEFDDQDVSRLLLGKSYVDFKIAYFHDVLKKKPHLYDGFSYRLVEIDAGTGGLSLSFARSKYFGYINSCEILAFEAALGMLAPTRNDPVIGRFWGNNPSRIFDLSNRNAIAGICTLLVLSDSGGRPSFVMHSRDDVIEGRHAVHVVPAGNFQPMIASDSGWTEAAWEGDYCILDAILREFIEEILGFEESVRLGSRTGNWRANDDVRIAYEKLVAATQSDSGPAKCRIWFFGVGIDPLTSKPELLACMVMDRKFFDDLNPNLTHREGYGSKLDLTLRELTQMDNSFPWLSAGRACIQLLRKHYDLLLTSSK